MLRLKIPSPQCHQYEASLPMLKEVQLWPHRHGDYEILPYIYSKVDNSTRLISTVIGERVDDVTNIRACDCGAFIFVVPGVDRS
jgi:hypothetical protein